MKRPLAIVALVLLGACCAPPGDPRLGALLDDEIATLGSAAKVGGPRSVAQIASITADVQAAQRNRAKGWGK